MSNFRQRLQQFFNGRNGNDQLNNFLLWAVLVMIIISSFTRSGILYLLSLVVLFGVYFRMMSKQIHKRRKENEWFLNHTVGIRNWWSKTIWQAKRNRDKAKNRKAQSATYKFYKCPSCGQEVRVPKNRGKIEISCPKCSHKFIKNTGKKPA